MTFNGLTTNRALAYIFDSMDDAESAFMNWQDQQFQDHEGEAVSLLRNDDSCIMEVRDADSNLIGWMV